MLNINNPDRIEMIDGQFEQRGCMQFATSNVKDRPAGHPPVCSSLLIDIQSTLVISKSKGLSEILRDIRISTYQICRIE